MFTQRITVTTISRESADTIYRVMNTVSWIDDAHMPSFTDSGDTFTVSANIPTEKGNFPLECVWGVIGRYLSEITSYTSEAN